jgi:hypothetical protein
MMPKPTLSARGLGGKIGNAPKMKIGVVVVQQLLVVRRYRYAVVQKRNVVPADVPERRSYVKP